MDAEIYMLTHSTILLTALAIVFFLLGLFVASLVYAVRTRKMKEYRDRLADCETSSTLLKSKLEELQQQVIPADNTPESTFTPSAPLPETAEANGETPAEAEPETETKTKTNADVEPSPDPDPDPKPAPTTSDEDTPGFLFPDAPEDPDDLTQIKGIGVILQGSLNKLGIYKYNQIALWTDDHVSQFSEQLTFKDRIHRDNWRAQAKELLEKKQSTPNP